MIGANPQGKKSSFATSRDPLSLDDDEEEEKKEMNVKKYSQFRSNDESNNNSQLGMS